MKEKLLLLFLAAATAFGSSMLVASNVDMLVHTSGMNEDSSRVRASAKSLSPDPAGLRDHASQSSVSSSSIGSDSDGGEHCCHHHAAVEGDVNEIASAVVRELERGGGPLDRLGDDGERVDAYLDGLNDEVHGLREEFNNSAASMRPHEFRDYLTQVCVDVIKAAQNGKVSAMTPKSLETLVRRVIDAHGANKIGGMTEYKFRAMLDERSRGSVGEMSGAALKKLITDTVRDVLIRQEAAEKVTAEKAKTTQENLARTEREKEATAVAEYRAAHSWKARASDCKNKVVCCCKRVPVAVQTAVVVIVTQVAMRMAGF